MSVMSVAYYGLKSWQTNTIRILHGVPTIGVGVVK